MNAITMGDDYETVWPAPLSARTSYTFSMTKHATLTAKFKKGGVSDCDNNEQNKDVCHWYEKDLRRLLLDNH